MTKADPEDWLNIGYTEIEQNPQGKPGNENKAAGGKGATRSDIKQLRRI